MPFWYLYICQHVVIFEGDFVVGKLIKFEQKSKFMLTSVVTVSCGKYDNDIKSAMQMYIHLNAYFPLSRKSMYLASHVKNYSKLLYIG